MPLSNVMEILAAFLLYLSILQHFKFMFCTTGPFGWEVKKFNGDQQDNDTVVESSHGTALPLTTPSTQLEVN